MKAGLGARLTLASALPITCEAPADGADHVDHVDHPALQALHELRTRHEVVTTRLHWATHRPKTYEGELAMTAQQSRIKRMCRELVRGLAFVRMAFCVHGSGLLDVIADTDLPIQAPY